MDNGWADALIDWYKTNMRPLPWRRTGDPYAIWVSEVMLQQTRIEAVLPRYAAFLQAFPSVQHLAAAPAEDVLRLWQGMGYYSRARNLHKGAQYVVQQCGATLPTTLEGLRAVPGIGEYTAGAIASIAYGLPTPAIDGNVLRVMARLRCLPFAMDTPAARRQVRELLHAALLGRESAALNQGIMELGQSICLPTSPRCDRCPIAKDCLAYRRGMQAELPLRIPKPEKTRWDVWALVAVQKDCVWLRRRAGKGIMAGLWEFPNLTLPAGTPPPDLRADWGIAAFPPPTLRFCHTLTHQVWDIRGCFTQAEVHPPGAQLLPLAQAANKPLPTCMRKLFALLDDDGQV